MNIRQYLRSILLIALVAFSGMSQAAIVEVIQIGTWTGAPGSGNATGSPDNGPGMATGQKYVIKIQYEDTSTVKTRNVPTELFNDSLQDMSVIELTGITNTLDIFVPMEGLDSGTPFIYTQDESDHYFDSVLGNAPIATLNFVLGTNVSNTANIIGVEFEGDFFPGSSNNIIELYNTAEVDPAPDDTPADNSVPPPPINQVGQVLNLGTGIAIREVNGLADSVAVTADDDTVTYDAASLMQTTNTTPQSNDLGAGRSDGETFLDSTWTESGGVLPGTLQANGVDIEVAIANSGLTSTTSSATWDVDVTEQMTGLGDTAQVLVDYANAAPSSTLSATDNAANYDFAYSSMDADLAVNVLIAGFELLTFGVTVDGVASSLFLDPNLFDDLINSGALSLSDAVLLAEFGAGLHTLAIMVTDLAGAQFMSSADFNLDDIPPIPIPPAFALMLTALAFLGVTGFRRRS